MPALFPEHQPVSSGWLDTYFHVPVTISNSNVAIGKWPSCPIYRFSQWNHAFQPLGWNTDSPQDPPSLLPQVELSSFSDSFSFITQIHLSLPTPRPLPWLVLGDVWSNCNWSVSTALNYSISVLHISCKNAMALLICYIFSKSSTFNPNISCNLNFTPLYYTNFQLNTVWSIEWSSHWLPAFGVLCLSMVKSFLPDYVQVMNLIPKKMIVIPVQPVNSHLFFKATLSAFPDFLSSE